MKTDMRYIPELQEASRMEEVVVVGVGGGSSELRHVKSLLRCHVLYML
jgi:hypothetical protein